MRTAKQLSVSLVNKPGRLADVLGALAKGKVNFLALSVMDSRERGTVRFVPDEFSAATEVLEKLNIRFDAADVLIVSEHALEQDSDALIPLTERARVGTSSARCSAAGVASLSGSGFGSAKSAPSRSVAR